MDSKINFSFLSTLFWQLFRFGIVGVSCAICHLGLVIFQVELFHLHPLIANIFAFTITVQLSYWGHRLWTFKYKGEKTYLATFSRLVTVSLSAFIANETLFYLFMTYLHLSYIPALILVLTILPLVVFTFHRRWVFT